MTLFGPPIGKVNAILLNGKSEDELSVANADTLDGMDSTDFATTGDIPTDYGDVNGPESATNGNFPILDVTGKILSDSTYAPDDFATVAHAHTSYVATSDYEDLDVLNKIKNVDGYKSGLDADLWRGYTPQNITISKAYNATQLDGEYSYVYKNVVIFNGICNTPSSTYSGATYMVGISPSGDFAGFPFGTIVRYNGSSWDVIGNV